MEALKLNPEPRPASHTHFLWDAPEKNVAIQVAFTIVDQLLMEVMRGFGAIPRRGAEVGGLLLGRREHGEKTVVHIEGFLPLPCEHRLGPSYLLSETDMAEYETAFSKHRPHPDKGVYAVGCYRSHTREGLGLTKGDLDHFENFFPEPAATFLLIKPFATKASQAGFFFREEDGSVHSEHSYLEFPFRRKELGGGSAPEPKPRAPRPAPAAMAGDAAPDELRAETAGYAPEPAEPPEETHPPKRHGRANVWIPLSFVFLLLGVLVGFQAALLYRPARAAGVLSDPFVTSLTGTPQGNALRVRWDRASAAIRYAQRGVLTITDSTYTTNVELDVAQLNNPNVIYRNISERVGLRLEIFTRDKTSVVETFEWRK